LGVDPGQHLHQYDAVISGDDNHKDYDERRNDIENLRLFERKSVRKHRYFDMLAFSFPDADSNPRYPHEEIASHFFRPYQRMIEHISHDYLKECHNHHEKEHDDQHNFFQMIIIKQQSAFLHRLIPPVLSPKPGGGTRFEGMRNIAELCGDVPLDD
jgi:hypothetical protein